MDSFTAARIATGLPLLVITISRSSGRSFQTSPDLPRRSLTLTNLMTASNRVSHCAHHCHSQLAQTRLAPRGTIVAAATGVLIPLAFAEVAGLKPDRAYASLIAIALVSVSAAVFTARTSGSPPPVAHRIASFPSRTALAGNPNDHLYRVPSEMPSETATPSVPATASLSPAERHLLDLRALHLAPPDYLLEDAIKNVPGAGRRVVLTFDDGPSQNTTQVLSILRRHDAHATFFFVGRRAAVRHSVLPQVIAEGSEIGNHTLDHSSLLARGFDDDVREIRDAEAVFVRYVGVRPRWVRPMAGWADWTGLDAIRSLGKRDVFWDDFGNDTVPTFTPERIASSVLENVHPGAIILLHETNPRTVEALPGILRSLHRRGYEVVTLTEAIEAARRG